MSYVALGQTITGQQSATDAATGLADQYTYGAASQALSQGQAMQAWAELAKKQNYPAIKDVTTNLNCPAGYLFNTTSKSPYLTCVNKDNVHVAFADTASCNVDASHSNLGWWYCAEVVRYLRLHGPGSTRSQTTNNTMAALRALKMTTGSYGWTNVKSQLRAVAWLISKRDGGDVDDIQAELEKSIGPYYDKDVAAAKNAPAATIQTALSTSLLASIASMMKPKTTTMASTATTKPGPTKMSPVLAVGIGMGVAAAGAAGFVWWRKHRRAA